MILRGRLLLPPFYRLENQGLERLNSFCPRAHRASVDYWNIIRRLNQMGTKHVHGIEQCVINRQNHFHSHPKTELRSDTICFTFFPNLVQPRGPEASILQQQKVSQPEEGEGPEKGAWKGRTQEAHLGARNECCRARMWGKGGYGESVTPLSKWIRLIHFQHRRNLQVILVSQTNWLLVPSKLAARFLRGNQSSYFN